MTEPTNIDQKVTSTHAEEEPILRGTIFLTIVLLMLIFGFWIMMYLMLLDL